jgi:hypothetical protein
MSVDAATPPGGPQAGLTREERARALGECPTPGHSPLDPSMNEWRA